MARSSNVKTTRKSSKSYPSAAVWASWRPRRKTSKNKSVKSSKLYRMTKRPLRRWSYKNTAADDIWLNNRLKVQPSKKRKRETIDI